MISGAAATATTAVAPEGLHSLHDIRKAHISGYPRHKRRSVCTRSSALPESLSLSAAALSGRTDRDQQQQGELKHTRQNVTSKKEDGSIEVWRTGEFSQTASTWQLWGIPVDSRQPGGPISELAVGSSADEATVTQGGIQAEDGKSTTAGDMESSNADVSGDGIKLDLMQELTDVKTNGTRPEQAGSLIEEETSRAFFGTSPYSPVEGEEAVQFAIVCACVRFLVRQLLRPDIIFKQVFQKESPDDDELKGDEQSPEGFVIDEADEQRSASQRAVTGFGQRKNNAQKSRRRK